MLVGVELELVAEQAQVAVHDHGALEVALVAVALPAGLTHWDSLSGWKPPKGTVYGFYAKNLYGMKVIDVEYQVLRTYGGSYKGKGRYLTGVTIEPLLVSVAPPPLGEVGWGWCSRT